MATVEERVAERYPDLLPLLRHPEVGRLLRQAVDPNKPLSQGSFMSKLRTTRWFRTQSESQRRWWVTSRMDPGEAAQQRALTQQNIAALARQMGIQPTRRELELIREGALARGVGADDFWVRNSLMQLTNKGGRTDVGAWTTIAREITELGNGQYLKNYPPHVLKKWTQWIVTGQRTMEDFQAAAQKESVKRFPHMAEQLNAGLTVRDVVQPWVDIYAQEMDTTADVIFASMAKHAGTPSRQLLGIRDPKTGQTRMPTEQEAVKIARSQPTWWQTSGGREADHRMTRTLLNAFGERKS